MIKTRGKEEINKPLELKPLLLYLYRLGQECPRTAVCEAFSLLLLLILSVRDEQQQQQRVPQKMQFEAQQCCCISSHEHKHKRVSMAWELRWRQQRSSRSIDTHLATKTNEAAPIGMRFILIVTRPKKTKQRFTTQGWPTLLYGSLREWLSNFVILES